ncbi:MAG: hypothetical protein ABEI80_00605 [Haloplanus sp.]
MARDTDDPDDPDDAGDQGAGGGAAGTNAEAESGESRDANAEAESGESRDANAGEGSDSAAGDEDARPLDSAREGGEGGDDNRGRSVPGSPPVKRTGGSHSASGSTADEPHVSLTIEGEYDSVFERVEHPDHRQHGELDHIMENVESTLQAVIATGGGIRSEIYDATDFELDDPWEIRKYLEVLAMHDLIRLQDDRWIPAEHYQGSERSG